jgi:hypothetical protein
VPSYRLKSPIVGVAHSATGIQITQIGTGVILDMDEKAGRGGMVETVYQGRMVEVFLDDLLQRAEVVDGSHA